MIRPGLATLLFVTLAAALISLGLPWISVGRIGFAVAFAAFVVAIATTALAIVVHRKRGLWTILAAIPALFWPAVAISFAATCSIYGDCD
jgi:ethanolamine transporter EutH